MEKSEKPSRHSACTVQTAGRLCNVSPRTISNWIEAGHIPAHRTVGGHRRIRWEDLHAFMQKQGIPLPEEPPVEDAEPKRILVVDDDPIIVETLTQALEEDENRYEVQAAADGFEAGIQVRAFRPHLLILDIMMAGLKGDEVCRRVKSDPATASIKILVLSAYLDEEQFARMKRSGADVCFSKPLPLTRLKAEIAGLLGPG